MTEAFIAYSLTDRSTLCFLLCGCGWFCRFLLLLRADSYLIRRRTIGRAAEPFIADHFPILIHLLRTLTLQPVLPLERLQLVRLQADWGFLLHDFRRLVNRTS